MTFMLAFLLGSIGTGLFARLWSFCIGDPYTGVVRKGRVFSNFGNWLNERYWKREADIELKYGADAVRRPPNWYKSLGMCPQCFCVWASLLSFVVLFGLLWWLEGASLLWLLVLPIYLGFSNLSVVLAERL